MFICVTALTDFQVFFFGSLIAVELASERSPECWLKRCNDLCKSSGNPKQNRTYCQMATNTKGFEFEISRHNSEVLNCQYFCLNFKAFEKINKNAWLILSLMYELSKR